MVTASFSQSEDKVRRSRQEGIALRHYQSKVGLDKRIYCRRTEGDFLTNIVHIEAPFGKSIEDVYEGVHDGQELGRGITGIVRLVTHKETGIQYAVKCLDLEVVESEEGKKQLLGEIDIMCQLDHPNIVRLEEVYESDRAIYLVQDLCFGGDLFDRLDMQQDDHYTEEQCARLVKQMLCSLRYIHSKGIIHRDLKLENFLFSEMSPDSPLNMIDFGLAKHLKRGQALSDAVGTPYTVAPEVILGRYDERCDIWSIGVITFLLLSGSSPFGGMGDGGRKSMLDLRENILNCSFKFAPEDTWNNVSDQAKDFIRKLLVSDPNHRPTAKQCQEHPWLCEWSTNKDNKGLAPALNPKVVENLMKFKEYSDIRKLLSEVLSHTLLPKQLAKLRKEFEKLDVEGSGEISLICLRKALMDSAGAGSLGALTEEDVEDVFNALRFHKDETRIYWHEFIAAELSQCRVDHRNLKLAFNRLDYERKGYITFKDIRDLMGSDATDKEDDLLKMWQQSMLMCKCKDGRLCFDAFAFLMKDSGHERHQSKSSRRDRFVAMFVSRLNLSRRR